MSNEDDQLDRLLATYTVAPADAMLAQRLASLARPRVLPLGGWRRALAACFVALAGFALGALQGADMPSAPAQTSPSAQVLWSLGAGQPVIF